MLGWNRKGFRIYWRWRSRRSGRSKTSAEIHDLIRRMSAANPLWGAHCTHGELLKLGADISRSTVGRYLPRRPKTPSPTWRIFPHNHLDTAAIDMFIVATATFRNLGICCETETPRTVQFSALGLSGWVSKRS